MPCKLSYALYSDSSRNEIVTECQISATDSDKLMKFLRISAIFLFCAALLVVGSLYYINSSPEYVGTYRLDIESGMSAKQIGDQLAKEKLIRSSFFFRILAQFKKFDRRINAGSHWISGLEDTDKILDALLSGGLDTRKITIPEGLSLPEVAELLQHELSFTVTEFMKVAADPQIVHRYGPQEAISMEGYLFPDTYSFHARSRPRDVIALMSARHNEHYS